MKYHYALHLFTVLLCCLRTALAQYKVVLTNDDGWAEAQIRAEYEALNEAGFDVSESMTGRVRLLIRTEEGCLVCSCRKQIRDWLAIGGSYASC